MSLPNYGNIFPDDILGRIRDLEAAVNELEGGTFAAVVTLAGDVTGQSDATVVEAIQGYAVSSTAPGSGEVLEWDGSAWTPTALGGGTGDLSKNVANAGITTWTSLRTASTAPSWRMERSLGTAGSPTAVTVGYTMGGFTFGGYDGTGWASDAAAGIFGKTSENWSSTAHGMFLSLETTPEGSTTRSEALRITAGGDLLNVRGFQSLRPDGRFSYQQRASNLFLAKNASAVIKEVVVADSMASVGLSTAALAESQSWPAVYEAEMASLYNLATRTSGFMPVFQYGSSSSTATGISWDTVQGSAVGRGPTFQNRRLTGSQYCEVARDGTAVTVYYTAQDAGGGTATVTINGTTAGTIDSTDGTLAAGTYDSGRSVTYTRTGLGPINLKVQITAGTAFELEGCYFHNQNSSAGYQLIRADKSGQTFSAVNDAATPYVFQAIGNIQPNIVTVMLGQNDVAALSLTPSQLADQLVTFVTNVRAEYSTWTPTIRYVFSNENTWLGVSNWTTDYKLAMRNACLENDVQFVDGHDAVGSILGSDPLDFSDDTLHPNQRGHWVWGKMIGAVTTLPSVPRRTLLSLNDSNFQTIGAQYGQLRLASPSALAGAAITLARDSGSAVATNDVLGWLYFAGATDAYSSIVVSSGVTSVAEGNWSGTNLPSGLRFVTTATSAGAVRGGFTKDGDFYVGASSGTAKLTVVGSSGNTTIAGTLDVTGATSLAALSVSGTHPFLSVDGNYSTITGSLGVFGAGAFANAPLLALRRAQGTSGSPTNITSGLTLAVLGFYGYNSGNLDYLGGAFVRAVSEEPWSTTGYRGTRLEFLTALSATNSAAVVRTLIDNAGKFYVGATAAGALASIDQTGNIVAATATLTQATVGNTVMQLTSTATNDDPTELVRQFRGTTTNGTATAAPGIGSFTPTAGTQTTVQAVVTARRTGGTAGSLNDGAGYLLYATFRVTPGGTVTSTGTSYTTIGEHQAGWDAQLKTDGTVIYVEVTGALNNNVTWHATVRSWSVGS